MDDQAEGFSFFQLLRYTKDISGGKRICFSFFQLLPESRRHKKDWKRVLVSFSCYYASPHFTYIAAASFSFFQLLQVLRGA